MCDLPRAAIDTRRQRRRAAAILCAIGLCAWAGIATQRARAAQDPQFRGGTNLVRLDVYVSKDGAAVTDLTAQDFEVLEDNVPQTVSSFELVRARRPQPDAARIEPSTVAAMRERAARPDARVFVLFLDTPHVQLSGSYRAANPVAAMLDRVVGADDLVGVMTPDMTARNMTLSPRTGPIGDLLHANWAWGERGRPSPTDPREEELRACYPDPAIAEPLILKRCEQKTLRAFDDLIAHLEATRDERTFVFVLTEGWRLSRPDETLARPLPGAAPGAATDPGGRLGPAGVTGRADPSGRSDAAGSGTASASCERERGLVALADHAGEFRLLLQRANRANVSFYPIDARGLVVFDRDAIAATPGNPSLAADAAGLAARRDALRTLAAETDGDVVLDTALERALPRLLTDTGAYYLLGYVSSNSKLDGRYRRLTVRVRRPEVAVRARPGYLAPTARDVARGSSPAAPSQAGTPSGSASTRVADALSRLPVARRAPVAYLDATAGAGAITAIVEIDRAAAAGEWAKGGVVRLAVTSAERPSGLRAGAEATLAAGTRVHVARLPDGTPLAPGRYQVRAEALPNGGRSPVVVTTLVDVPADGTLLGTALLASRRGPGTAGAFAPTADARYRRTERLRLETPRLAADVTAAARLLNRAGQTLQVPVSVTDVPTAFCQPWRS